MFKRPGKPINEKKIIADEISNIAFNLDKTYIDSETAVAKLYVLSNELRNEFKEECKKAAQE